MTTAQVVETSVTNNSLSKDYLHPDDHAKQLIFLLFSGASDNRHNLEGTTSEFWLAYKQWKVAQA